MKKYTLFGGLLSVSIFLSSCQNVITSGSKLDKADKAFLRSLHILGSDEIVFNFYTEHRRHISGNFYTDRRIASYWTNDPDQLQHKTESAYYNDITNIDTVLDGRSAYCPYMMVTRDDSSTFKAYFDGDMEEVRSAFNQAISMWRYHRSKDVEQD